MPAPTHPPVDGRAGQGSAVTRDDATHDTAEVLAMARAITAAHVHLRLPAAEAPAVPWSGDAPVYRAARRAARALGFIDADAQCVARAWQAQVARTGSFAASDWPCEPADFGLRESGRAGGQAFAPCPRTLGLYAVLPDADWVGRMARAGVPTVQLRFKSTDAAAVRREVHAAVAAVQGTSALLFVNDHWREAMAAGAYGVHLGQEDIDGADLDAIRAAGLRLGLSSHGYAEMLRAAALDPSYLALGAVYPTTLKRMPTPPQGPARLAAYARLMRSRSLVAIGGIDASRLAEVRASGVGSFAVVRALVAAADPLAQVRHLQALWQSADAP
jgi:thiamine-phosphate pyrophosphorylase